MGMNKKGINSLVMEWGRQAKDQFGKRVVEDDEFWRMAEKGVGGNGPYRGQKRWRRRLAGEEGCGRRKVRQVRRRRALPPELHVHGSLERLPTHHSTLGHDITARVGESMYRVRPV